MLKIGVVGCGLQAATIASYMGVYNDPYEVAAVVDYDFENARSRLAQKSANVSSDCQFFKDVDEFIASGLKLDGIIIGTYCTYHTEMACRLEPLGIPLYIEKPVAISREQLMRLYHTFKDSRTVVEVSLPMRLCPLIQRARKILQDGLVGPIYQIIGYEDTPGDIYFATWFRDAEKTGGMFMQKAVHDIDYMLYLAGSRPAEVCAMRAKLYHRGDKPYDMTCEKCPDKMTCTRGPAYSFAERGYSSSVPEAIENLSTIITPDGKVRKDRYCVFSRDIQIEDVGECLIRLESGVHLCHTQNFIAEHHACRRGARFTGRDATLEVDFNNACLDLYSHVNPSKEHYEVSQGKLSHYGGDRALVYDFLQLMKTGKRPRTDLIQGDGIMSTLACISARESADSSQFVKIQL